MKNKENQSFYPANWRQQGFRRIEILKDGTYRKLAMPLQ
jgi:hypothetical protein